MAAITYTEVDNETGRGMKFIWAEEGLTPLPSTDGDFILVETPDSKVGWYYNGSTWDNTDNVEESISPPNLDLDA